MGDNQDGLAAGAELVVELFDPADDVSKTLTTGKRFVNEGWPGAFELLNGTPGPGAVIAFAQPRILYSSKLPSCKRYFDSE
jgi:hypothetical protein